MPENYDIARLLELLRDPQVPVKAIELDCGVIRRVEFYEPPEPVGLRMVGPGLGVQTE